MPPDQIMFHLPMPPSANNLFAGKQRRYPTKAYTQWKRTAGIELMRCRPGKMTGRVGVLIDLTAKDKRRRDADNYIKPIVDLIVAHSVLPDDSRQHVGRVTAQWVESDRVGALVRITPL